MSRGRSRARSAACRRLGRWSTSQGGRRSGAGAWKVLRTCRTFAGSRASLQAGRGEPFDLGDDLRPRALPAVAAVVAQRPVVPLLRQRGAGVGDGRDEVAEV